LFKIDSSEDFWGIMDELLLEYIENGCKKGFYCNRATLLKYFMEGAMYGLYVKENDKMYKRGAGTDDIFCSQDMSRMYMLPCFVIKENNRCMFIWVAKRARRMGFGTKLVKFLGIKSAWLPLPESIKFWQNLSIKMVEPEMQDY